MAPMHFLQPMVCIENKQTGLRSSSRPIPDPRLAKCRLQNLMTHALKATNSNR